MLNVKEKIKEIQEATGLKISSYKIINRGFESLIIEVNKKWIFRFPRNQGLRKKTKERLNYLASFSMVSPLKIPEPKFIENGFIGYKKIPGKPFYPANFKKLTEKEKTKTAKQIGLFLKTLHAHKNKRIDFNTGYLVMRKEDYKTPPLTIAKRLNLDERKALKAKIGIIAKNPLNFKKPSSIIHGDLNFNNILWDPEKKSITGIIDWAELGLGMPAMDFIMLADFNVKKNDKFLKEILKYYGVKGNDLLFQIKENAIIDVMNWFWSYHKEKNQKGMARMIGKLKRILAHK
ncbi:MAG: aminoglycoside phosphotransferase family protein [Patescibacteria group bacterium]|jgi:aminoglycoside phosphotransferase (APT) family kinase protein